MQHGPQAMSRGDQTLPTRELLPAMESTASNKMSLPDSTHQPRYTPHETHDTYDDAIFDEFYDLGTTQNTTESTQKKPTTPMAAPPVPERNSLRSSRLLDNLGLKLGGSMTPQSLSQTTPHDLYLSSEEDASSSADDFSDYDYDSSSEDGASPGRRVSHEITARVVSVIFSGKPSLVDLSQRRPTSPSSTAPSSTRSRSHSTVDGPSNASSMSRRVSTSSGSLASVANHPSRQSSIFSTILPSMKKAPLFLDVDPYANGSTYSLDATKEDRGADETPRTPRTPGSLFKGMSRTLTLVKKRSRPLLKDFVQLQPQAQAQAQAQAPCNRDSVASALSQVLPSAEPAEPRPSTSDLPQGPVTYNDIIRAAKNNVKPTPAQPETPTSSAPASATPELPLSPSPGKKGFLGSLAARRRSIKVINGKLL